MRDSSNPPGERRWMLAILALALLIYLPSLANGFAMDDKSAAQAIRGVDGGDRHPLIADAHGPLEYFRHHYWYGSFHASDLYRPITVMSFAYVYQGVGRFMSPEREAMPQHAVNVLLHLLATWLCWRLARPLGGRVALVTAAWFAVLGIHSEAVIGVVGRAELLAFDLGVIALLLSRRPGWFAGIGSALALFLAFCSKESAVGWLPLLALYGVVADTSSPRGLEVGGASPWRRLGPALVRALWIGALPLALFLWLRHAALSPVLDKFAVAYGANPLAFQTPMVRILSACTFGWLGLAKTVIPWNLSSDYGPVVLPIDPATGPLAAAGWLLLLVGGVFLWGRKPTISFAIGLWFTFWLPVSNIPFATGTVFGERLFYAPSLGVALAMAWFARGCSSRLWAAILALLLGWHAVAAGLRNAAWRDDATLFNTDSQRQPRSVKLLCFRAVKERDADHLDQAIALSEQALALDPEDPEAAKQLACYYFEKQDWARAETLLRRAMASTRFRPKAAGFGVYGNLGSVLLRLGRIPEACAMFDQALTCPIELGSAPILLDYLQLAHGRVRPDELARLMDGIAAMVPAQELIYHRGMVAAARGDLVTAERLLEQSLAETQAMKAALDLIELRKRMGKIDGARVLLQQLLAQPDLAPQARRDLEQIQRELR